MQITIVTIGSRGDEQPFVALALGFLGAGHDVRLATHAIFETDIRSRGLDFSPIAGNIQEMLASEAGHELLEKSSNPLAVARGFKALSADTWEQMADDCWNACQGADAIIHSFLAVVCPSVAEKRRVPFFAAYLQPASRTRAFPYQVTSRHMGGFYNRLTYIIGEQVLWQAFRPITNRWRRERLGLPPLPFLGDFGKMWKQHYPILYGYSPSVVPKPPDWGEWVHVTGYWFLDHPSHWQPPADLVDFLQAGPPPVYIGFGSMEERHPEEVTEIVLKALEYSKQRGVLLVGWGGLSKVDLPDHVFEIESVPHDWLFPQMAAVVHHGGAGTTAAGLRAGVPSIIVPFFLDQPFWGERVYRLGVGPKPTPLRQLSAQHLANAIKTAVSDREMQVRAADLGKRIRSEDGVARAVEAVEQHLSML